LAAYKENFPVGSKVIIAEAKRLEEFQATWKFHHKLESKQLAFAGWVAEVERVSFYHGGDVLYELRDMPGIWHEQCFDVGA
jgi:hypothetical protein